MPKRKSRAARQAQSALNPDKPNKPGPRRPPTPPRSLDFKSEEVNRTLFPGGKPITLSDGTKVRIQKWPIRMYGEMAQRIPETMEHALKGKPDDSPAIAAVFDSVIDEVIYMVARTIDWETKKVEEMCMDDLLLLANEVWDYCIAGPAAKTAGLLGRVMGTLGAPGVLKIGTKPDSSSRSTS